jgi:hypothetical protein
MEPPNPLSYKRRSKLRSGVKERFSGLNAQQKNATIQRLQERLGNADAPNRQATQARLSAARSPLIQRALQSKDWKRPEVEGFSGAKKIGSIQDRLAAPTSGKKALTPERIAALQAKLAEQKGLRKQIGTSRRTALGEDFDRTKLAYGKKKKTATASNQSATPL